jgi:hypothetical protein
MIVPGVAERDDSFVTRRGGGLGRAAGRVMRDGNTICQNYYRLPVSGAGAGAEACHVC